MILASDIVALWEGVHPTEEEETDFDRACDVQDYIGLVPFAGGDALVLGDDPYPTALLIAPAFGGAYIVRRLWGENVELALASVHEIAPSDWTPEGVVFHAGDGEIVLFDAVHEGDSAPERVSLVLGPGSYAIETADMQPDDDLCLMVHRLVPVA